MREKYAHLIDLDEIVADINKFSLAKKMSNQAILDATKMNPVNLHGDRKVAGAGEQNSNFEKKFDKLKPWLMRVEKNQTHNHKIIDQLRRVKVLDVRQETFYVNRANLITEEQVWEFEAMMKPKARFVQGNY